MASATPTRSSVKINSATLDVVKHKDEERLIIRGWVDPDSYDQLRLDKYQRAQFGAKIIRGLMDPVNAGTTPDIVLGMRGSTTIERDGSIYLQDPTYIIDGQQRTAAARMIIAEDPSEVPHLGCQIHLDTDYAFELALFEELNLKQKKLSPNVTLRNQDGTYSVATLLLRVATLASTGASPDFVLRGRINWDQKAKSGDLISAMTYYRVVGALHAHVAPGRATQVIDLVKGLDRQMAALGETVYRENIITFFDVVDKAWGVQNVSFTQGATQLRAGFLLSLAEVFSSHDNFWDDKGRLVVPATYITSLRTFNVFDPSVMSLAGSNTTAQALLTGMLVQHLNSRRTSNRLRPRGMPRRRRRGANTGDEVTSDA